MSNCAVILAGGQGKRMKSNKPKALCEVLFKPMIDWTIDAARSAKVDDICVVTGHLHEMLEEHLAGETKTVFQAERLGTGHAVMQAVKFIEEFRGGNTLILNGDCPLMDAETIRGALAYHEKLDNAVTVISAEVENPFGYGRIIRDAGGFLSEIVEEKDASVKQREIKEVNSGAYWFKTDVLLEALSKITNKNKQHEYYLTDCIEIAIKAGLRTSAFAAENSDVVLGANDRIQLLDLNDKLRYKFLQEQMLEGVDIPCSEGIIIGPDVVIGQDTRILPGTVLLGDTKIGKNCVIGPNSYLTDCVVGSDVVLDNVVAEQSKIGSGCDLGPFVHLRPGSKIGKEVHIGNFVEIKNSTIDDGTKVSHLTYVGDSDLGKNINMGCGCVTVNFDGQKKHRTVIGDGTFIGCNTNLISPVKLGKFAYTAAGSTIYEDVPDYTLAIARSRQENKVGWVKDKNKIRNME